MEWLRKHPIAAFLPLQALLCFWNLGLLSPWMDEATTLLVVRLPVREILRVASGDVHPPLYYLLVNEQYVLLVSVLLVRFFPPP